MEYNCISQCDAACCRKVRKLTGLHEEAQEAFRQAGMPNQGEVEFQDGCILVTDNKCPLHDTPAMPRVCDRVRPGGKECTIARVRARLPILP